MLPHTKALQAATGMKITMGDLMRIGARGFNLERTINARMGVSAKDDKLPKRLTDEEQVPGDPRTKVPSSLNALPTKNRSPEIRAPKYPNLFSKRNSILRAAGTRTARSRRKPRSIIP